jgi:serine/threonine protein kinase
VLYFTVINTISLLPQKPDNIGFDYNGSTKLFDFGLAKELMESQRTEGGLYKMTGFTGAVRYMAPEVGLGIPYNLSVDVYSWSMLMWFIMALEPPFGFYTEDMIVDRVFKRGSRPAIFDSWPKAIGHVLKRAWDSNVPERPAFSEICSTLRSEMVRADKFG